MLKTSRNKFALSARRNFAITALTFAVINKTTVMHLYSIKLQKTVTDYRRTRRKNKCVYTGCSDVIIIGRRHVEGRLILWTKTTCILLKYLRLHTLGNRSDRPKGILICGGRSWRRCLKRAPTTRRKRPYWSRWATWGLPSWFRFSARSLQTVRWTRRCVSMPFTLFDVSPYLPETRSDKRISTILSTVDSCIRILLFYVISAC